MISLRFYFYPSTFKGSILHPTESLFIPASVISLGTILLNITQYGTTLGRTGDWLLVTMKDLFWLYCTLAVFFSAGIYLVLYVVPSLHPVLFNDKHAHITITGGPPRLSLWLK